MEKKTFYITTPIYYPSGKFHLGTAYTTVLADTIKKYKQQRGYDARMLTGLDEHGQKVEQVAVKRGLTPQQHVDEIAKQAKDLWKLMDVQYNDFIRTTEERHTKIVEKILIDSWSKVIFIKENMRAGIVCHVKHILQKHN